MFLATIFVLMLGGGMDQQTIGILVFDGVLTSEVTAPAEVFGAAAKKDWFKQWHVKLIGLDEQPFITTQEGLRLAVDSYLAKQPNVAVLLVPGAYDVAPFYQHSHLKTFLQAQAKKAQWVGSNCSGAFLLGHAGLLDGKQATTWFGGEKSLQETFPAIRVAEGTPVVVDDARITSNGGLVSYDAAFVLLGILSSPEHAREIYDDLQASRSLAWKDLRRLMNQR